MSRFWWVFWIVDVIAALLCIWIARGSKSDDNLGASLAMGLFWVIVVVAVVFNAFMLIGRLIWWLSHHVVTR